MAQMRAGEVIQFSASTSSFRSSRMSDAEIETTIASVWQRYQYVIDPHTACGFTDLAPDVVSVILSTASPAKFPEVVTQATGHEPTHPTLDALKSLPLVTHPLPATDEAVKTFIAAHV
jgi:threonine synthase